MFFKTNLFEIVILNKKNNLAKKIKKLYLGNVFINMNEVSPLESQGWIPVFFFLILVLKLAIKSIFFISYQEINFPKVYLSFRNKNNYFFSLSVCLLAILMKSFLFYFFLSTSFFLKIRNGWRSYSFFFLLSSLFFCFFLFRMGLNRLIVYLFTERGKFEKIHRIQTFYLWKELKTTFPAALLVVYSFLPPNLIFIFLIFYITYLNVERWIIFLRRLIIPLSISIYYIIVYICIVEILPILAIFNYTIDFKNSN